MQGAKIFLPKNLRGELSGESSDRRVRQVGVILREKDHWERFSPEDRVFVEGLGMIGSLAVILGCQLLGEVMARGLGLPVPGPVLGMAVMVGVLWLRDRFAPPVLAGVEPAGRFLLAHLSLLFVPAGVGVVGNLEVLAAEWLALAVALGVSTVLTLVVSVVTFRAVARLMGQA